MIISLTLHSSYLQFKFCSSVIYFIKRSRNFGFAGQCFMSSFLLLICNFTSCLNVAFFFRGIHFFFIIRGYEIFTLVLVSSSFNLRKLPDKASNSAAGNCYKTFARGSIFLNMTLTNTIHIFFCNTHVYIFVRIYLNISISRRKYT